MDPEYISRKLSWVDAELRSREVAEDRTLQTFDEPLIILGDPGMGKTRLLEKLAERSGNRFIRAVSFLRQANDAFSRDDRLIIDGLDEVAAIEEGDPLHNVLAKLVSCGKPGFVISCRSIEWRSATGKIDIKDEYGVAPRELTLLPLSNDDAIAALAARVGPDRAKEAISGLDSAGLRELYENPLTLNFVASIVADESDRQIGKLVRRRPEGCVLGRLRGNTSSNGPSDCGSDFGKLRRFESLELRVSNAGWSSSAKSVPDRFC